MAKISDYTRNDFDHGKPPALVQAKAYPKILAVWPHGDELLGPRLGYYIQTRRTDLLDHVDYICGNPKAAGQDHARRYIETDLNRSFNPAAGPVSYEEHRAAEILDLIKENGYDFVLDLHTSTTDVGGFFIAHNRNPAVDKMIKASQISRIVMMPNEIAEASLIGQISVGISMEYDRRLLSNGVTEVVRLIDGLIADVPNSEPQVREFFYVTKPIPKTEDPGPKAKNFVLCKDGYYPVLFGERAYRRDPNKTYLGFAATKRELVSL